MLLTNKFFVRKFFLDFNAFTQVSYANDLFSYPNNVLIF